jgi:excisionase family DNA binding protein
VSFACFRGYLALMSFLWQMWHMWFATADQGEASMATGGARTFWGDGASLLTVAEVASAMRISTMTVYRLIKSGELPAVRVGRSYRVRGSAVEQYLTSRSVQVEGS